MRTSAILILAAGWACGLGAGCQAPPSPMTDKAYVAAAKKVVREVPPPQAAGELASRPDLFVLDVQEWTEYERSHLAGAVVIPRGYLEFKIARNDLFPPVNRGRSPRMDQPILVYCQLGSRSLLAAKTLQEMGYANVRSLQGGLKAWTDANLPVEKRPAAPPASGPYLGR